MVVRTMNYDAKRRAVSAAAIAALVGAHPALGQQSESVTVDVGECVNLESPEERLACYEGRVDAARSRGTSADSQPRSAEPPAGAAQENIVDAPRARDRDSRRASRDEATEQREFFGIIASLRVTVPNSFVITLENGEIWRQTQPKWYPLQPGQEVRIYSTDWWGSDSYRLSVDRFKGFIHVERLR
jgi:hypothetical protein